MDNIQIEEGKVIAFEGIRLDEPIGIVEFVDTMRQVRQAVDKYFEMVLKADDGLKSFLKGDSAMAKIAYKFKDSLVEEFAAKHGVTIQQFRPAAEPTRVSTELKVKTETKDTQFAQNGNDKKSAIDYHIEYKNMVSTKDVENDALVQEIVALSEGYIRHRTRALDRAPENRKHIRLTTAEIWKHIEKQFKGVSDALDPQLKDELPAILIESGWRVIGKVKRGEALYVLPFGLGVPGCFWAKTTDDDHPFWGV